MKPPTIVRVFFIMGVFLAWGIRLHFVLLQLCCVDVALIFLIICAGPVKNAAMLLWTHFINRRSTVFSYANLCVVRHTMCCSTLVG